MARIWISGLQEYMVIVTGVGEHKRGLGCLLASEALGFKIARMLPSLHVFTVCDS